MGITLTRLRTSLRYSSRSDPVYKWRLSRATCPACGGRFFLSMKPDAFMTRCLGCGANGTNLSLIPVIQRHAGATPVQRAWEMSTYGATLRHLKATVAEVIESEYFPDAAPGELVDGILNQDVQRLSFEDASLDLITSNHVFEHVADDVRWYRECFRALKPGGALVFSVPLSDEPATRCLAEQKDGEIVHHAEPEYHDSRITGPRTALTFWRHSVNDICDRVSGAGFATELVDVRIAPSQKVPTQVVYAVKR